MNINEIQNNIANEMTRGYTMHSPQIMIPANNHQAFNAHTVYPSTPTPITVSNNAVARLAVIPIYKNSVDDISKISDFTIVMEKTGTVPVHTSYYKMKAFNFQIGINNTVCMINSKCELEWIIGDLLDQEVKKQMYHFILKPKEIFTINGERPLFKGLPKKQHQEQEQEVITVV
jgi:hypothetical protein